MDDLRLADRAALLRGGWLFSECTDDELERVAALAHPVHFPAGQVIVREGEPGDEFYVVVEGAPIADIGPGSFFGEMALLDGGERVATVAAITDVELLMLHRDEFNEMLLLAMPTIAPKLLAV